jgi:hypothetical protein
MKHFLIPFLSLAFCLNLQAQEFLTGEITFTNQRVMEGKIAVDFATNTVIVKAEEDIRIFHASILAQVTTLGPDEELNIYKTYQHKSPGVLNRWESKLFQVVTFGKIGLLKRGIDFATIEDGDGYTIYDWYLHQNGEIRYIKNFKRQVFDQMYDYGEEVLAYMQCSAIDNLNNGEALYEIVSYYNRLSNGHHAGEKWFQVSLPESD